MHEKPISRGTFRVLLVDDSAQEAYLIRRALERVPSLKLMSHAMDGNQAIQVLSKGLRETGGEGCALPDLLILDLKMHGVDGFGVLSWLQKHPIRGMMILVLTNSNLKSDINKAAGGSFLRSEGGRSTGALPGPGQDCGPAGTQEIRATDAPPINCSSGQYGR